MTLTGADYVGWLLRANRTIGAAVPLRSGRAFAAAFRPGLAPSHITRWETGGLLAGRATVRRYEQLLGLPAESLVTVRDALYRTLPAARRPAHPAGEAPAGRLHELLEAATGPGPLTGHQWGELTELIEARPGLVLHPPRLWQAVAGKLLDELTRHEGTGWLQRQEAASRLLEHSTAGPHVVRACLELIEDRASPAVVEPMALLDVRSDPVGNAYVLRQLDSPDSDRHHRGALLAVVRKISDGHFEGPQWAQLARSLDATPADGDNGRLAATARAALARRFLGEAPAPPPAGLTPGPDDVGERVAAAVGVDDPVLAALVGQSLGTSVDERLVAAMTIAQSPYRDGVAAALLTEARRDLAARRGRDISATLQALTLLGTDIHRPLLFDLLAEGGHDDRVRQAAAWATAHCPGRFTDQQWRRILHRQATAWQDRPVPANESVLHGIAYGVGTDHHRALLTQIAADPRLPAVARTTATWLRP
ncbi:hypothetical protein [Actinoplanes sp. NPDC051411]|uniref:hypothetical protein n=1 Tax=Actinoplanes sp. NPDC051411 TaxID=3155522 RepID=UPI0034137EAE